MSLTPDVMLTLTPTYLYSSQRLRDAVLVRPCAPAICEMRGTAVPIMPSRVSPISLSFLTCLMPNATYSVAASRLILAVSTQGDSPSQRTAKTNVCIIR